MVPLLPLIFGAALALKWDVSVLNQHLLLLWSLGALAGAGIILHALHVYRHLKKVSSSELISLGLQLQSVEGAGIAGCDLPDMLYLSSLG